MMHTNAFRFGTQKFGIAVANENPNWPPDQYDSDTWPKPWLRFETQYPNSGRPSRLVAHSFVPFVATLDLSTSLEEIQNGLKRIARHYLHRLEHVVGAARLGLPNGWLDALAAEKVGVADPDPLAWLDVWPSVGEANPGTPPQIKSWNLSRQTDHALPATIIMVASEVYIPENGVASHSFGLRVPMSVQKVKDEIRVIIRSMTAEYPRPGTTSFTEIFAGASDAQRIQRKQIQSYILGLLNTPANRVDFAKFGYVDEATVVHEEFSVSFDDPVNFVGAPFTATYVSKAAASSDPGSFIRPRFPAPASYQIISKYRFESDGGNPVLLNAETCPLVTHAANPGEAEVFVQTPPGWVDPADPAKTYVWTNRRPTRSDDVLDDYRIVRKIDTTPNNIRLEKPGFIVRLCPEYVPGDRAAADGGKTVKEVNLPGGEVPEPRRSDFSAVMAYCAALDFFQMLAHFGLDPAVFVVRAKKDIEIFYRYGIFPGAGRDGKTINAQVAYRCERDGLAAKPAIKMNLALANLSRWARPKLPNHKFGRPEPLGIATSGRWMMHEFGHYLIAARLGKLEFDFAHSAGDAMAAVYFDPDSRLGDRRGDMPESFRGFTYPFVFTTRRHDRSPLLGWGWYGTLNRSIIQAPPAACDAYKGYLTEQILSSSIFRLYRSLGGDTMAGDKPDRYIRYRASFMTLFLLIRAIVGLAQSPSRAEMLELGLEDVGLLMIDPLAVPPPISAPPPQADAWSGGVTHKVVRWAFESQGMFPQDELQITNGPGQAPPVDIYVGDQRPLDVPDVAGRTVYGPGSYAPVSLDWDGERLWTVAGNVFRIGNRSRLPSGNITGRLWIGVLQADTTVDRWDLTADGIAWIGSIALPAIAPLAPHAEADLELPDLSDKIETAQNTADGPVLLLLEINCTNDPANTNPNVILASAIANGDVPPTVPRAVTDLVANDNNLGLMILELS